MLKSTSSIHCRHCRHCCSLSLQILLLLYYKLLKILSSKSSSLFYYSHISSHNLHLVLFLHLIVSSNLFSTAFILPSLLCNTLSPTFSTFFFLISFSTFPSHCSSPSPSSSSCISFSSSFTCLPSSSSWCLVLQPWCPQNDQTMVAWRREFSLYVNKRESNSQRRCWTHLHEFVKEISLHHILSVYTSYSLIWKDMR